MWNQDDGHTYFCSLIAENPANDDGFDCVKNVTKGMEPRISWFGNGTDLCNNYFNIGFTFGSVNMTRNITVNNRVYTVTNPEPRVCSFQCILKRFN